MKAKHWFAGVLPWTLSLLLLSHILALSEAKPVPLDLLSPSSPSIHKEQHISHPSTTALKGQTELSDHLPPSERGLQGSTPVNPLPLPSPDHYYALGEGPPHTSPIYINNPKYVPNPKNTKKPPVIAQQPSVNCFPSLIQSITVPSGGANKTVLANWWCPDTTEYAFMGFSYDQTPCQSRSQLLADFKRMKSDFSSRYVRLYGACDNPSYNDDLVYAASGSEIGIYGLIWFGFDGTDEWKGRRDRLIKTIQTNLKAPYVFRNIAVGSEPLFDWVLSPHDLASQIKSIRDTLSPFGIQVTLSDMPYGYQIHDDAPQIFSAIDFVEGNVLPFFDSGATTGANAWGVISWSLSYFRQHAPGKVIRMTQTGWPSNDSVWKANSKTAIASVASEKAYYDLLDSRCQDLKSMNVGWFAQIWSDTMLPGWGILGNDGPPKFTFRPKTFC